MGSLKELRANTVKAVMGKKPKGKGKKGKGKSRLGEVAQYKAMAKRLKL